VLENVKAILASTTALVLKSTTATAATVGGQPSKAQFALMVNFLVIISWFEV